MASKYPGVRPLGTNRYEIRATRKDPISGKTKEAIRTVTAASIHEAAELRLQLRKELESEALSVDRWTVAAYCEWWLKRRAEGVDSEEPLRQGTLIRYAEHLERFCAALGTKYMDELTPMDIKEWLTAEGERPSVRSEDGKVSGYTTLGMLRTVRTVTKDAQADLRLPFWACQRVKNPKALKVYTAAQPNSLTPEQVGRMLDTMRDTEPRWFPLFAFMVDTGLRWCHAHAFEWGDLDLEAGRYQIGRSRYRGEVNPPSRRKSGHHEGPLPAELVIILRDLKARSTGALVFPSDRGGYLDSKSFARAINRAKRRAGIWIRFTPHGCRRTVASQVSTLAGEAVAQKLIGHATIEMTRQYQAHDIDQKRAAAELMVAARVGTSNGSQPAPNRPTDENLN